MFKKIILASALLFFVFSLSACSVSWPWQKNELNDDNLIIDDFDNTVVIEDNNLKIKKFKDYDELREFISSRNITDISERYYVDDIMLDQSSSGLDGALGSSQTFSSNSSFGLSASSGSSDSFSSSSFSEKSADYSKTNIQVEGVDEADIIKTDGKYIYVLAYSELFIIDAVPAEKSKIISSISFKSRPKEIYIADNRLAVIGSNENLNDERWYFKDLRSEFTFIDIFDISNVENPVKIKNLNFEGSYISSRVVDEKIYLVLSQYIKTANKDNLLPVLIDDGNILSSDCSLGLKCFSPDVYYLEENYDSYRFTSINSIDFKGQGDVISTQTYLLKSGQNIYSSLKNLYITYTQRNDNEVILIPEIIKFLKPKVNAEDRRKLEEMESDYSELDYESLEVIYDIFSNLEEGAVSELDMQKILIRALVKEADNIERTIIHKLSLNNGYVDYKTSTSVPGYILNQFFLDEDEYENLRIATTQSVFEGFIDLDKELDGEIDMDFSASNLFVLSPDLKILDSVRGLAKGERIYSVRFLGKRAYIVTFDEIDPLFVIDLSNPVKPILLGELKIPGYSTYLHPYDENTLIGFGRDTDIGQFGGVINAGLKLSLFDVLDPANPKELDSFIIGNSRSDSLALYNHKAFLFSREKNLLLVPAFLHNYTEEGFSIGGAMVLSIDNNKFKFRGLIDHSDNGKSSNYDNWCGAACCDNSVQRGLYINDAIYTFSNKYLKANSLNDLRDLSSVSLISKNADDILAYERDAKRISDVKQVQIALEMYYNDMGDYPVDASVTPGLAIYSNDATQPFLRAIPSPPTPIDGENCNVSSGDYDKNLYKYVKTRTSSGSSSYSIGFCLGSAFGDNRNKITGNTYLYMTPAGIVN